MRAFFWPFGIAAVFALSMLYAANWVRGQEAGFRLAEVERTLRAAGSHTTQTFALADTILQNAVMGLRERSPDDVPLAELREIERASVGGLTQVMRLYLFGRDGTSQALGSDVNVADRDYFVYQTDAGRMAPERALLTDAQSDLFVGAPVLGRVTNSWILSVSQPVRDATGASVGIAMVTIPLETFNDLFQALLAQPSDLFAMWRNDATILVRAPDNLEIRGRRYPNAAIWSHYPASPSGRYVAPTVTDGIKRVVVYQGLAPLPLVLVYAIEERGLTLDAAKRYWPLLAVAGATLLVALLFAWRTLRATRALQRSNIELRAAEAKARAAADSRGAFIANMNHELRTPLNAVIGFSQMISGQMLGPIGNKRYGEYAKDIEMSGTHLLALIDDIIDFSAVDGGHRPLETTSFDVAAAIDEAIKIARPLAEARRIRFALDIAPSKFAADARATRQILVNLLSNAIKFSPLGATVFLTGGTAESGFFRVAVTDQGAGIAPDELGQIGEAFYRADDARQKAIRGFGLGLSICKRLAQLMGGRIEIGNSETGGACVALVLPTPTRQ
jgi:signal transduction histidine kinase